MFKKLDELENLISKADLETRIIILILCIVIGMALSKFIFAKLNKIAIGLNIDTHSIIQKSFRGMPTLWGFLIGGYFALHIISVPPRGLIFLDNLFHFIGILSLTIMSARLISALLSLKLQKTAGTFASTSILVTTIELAVYITGSLFLLQSLNISITPFLTALGVGGLAVALALQDTLSNLFSGINVLLSKQIKIGDYIKLATGEEGIVKDLNWRNTNIIQASGNLVVVPNQKIATSNFTNYTLPNADCLIFIPVGVSYNNDMGKVEKVISIVAKEILDEVEGGIAGFEPSVQYSNFTENSINFSIALHVKNITYQNLIRHEFMKRLLSRFEQEGIVIHP